MVVSRRQPPNVILRAPQATTALRDPVEIAYAEVIAVDGRNAIVRQGGQRFVRSLEQQRAKTKKQRSEQALGSNGTLRARKEHPHVFSPQTSANSR